MAASCPTGRRRSPRPPPHPTSAKLCCQTPRVKPRYPTPSAGRSQSLPDSTPTATARGCPASPPPAPAADAEAVRAQPPALPAAGRSRPTRPRGQTPSEASTAAARAYGAFPHGSATRPAKASAEAAARETTAASAVLHAPDAAPASQRRSPYAGEGRGYGGQTAHTPPPAKARPAPPPSTTAASTAAVASEGRRRTAAYEAPSRPAQAPRCPTPEPQAEARPPPAPPTAISATAARRPTSTTKGTKETAARLQTPADFQIYAPACCAAKLTPADRHRAQSRRQPLRIPPNQNSAIPQRNGMADMTDAKEAE